MRALFPTLRPSLSCALTGRGGRPIKYVDHGGVWRLRMRAVVARAREGETVRENRQAVAGGRRGSGADRAAGEKEGTGRRAERGDECLAYGLCGARYRRDRLETGVHTRSKIGGFFGRLEKEHGAFSLGADPATPSPDRTERKKRGTRRQREKEREFSESRGVERE